MKIWCENTNSEYSVDYGTTLMDAAKALLPEQTGNRDILAALVDGQLKALNFHICYQICPAKRTLLRTSQL